MYEVEVKVEAAHGPVRARLADMDAERLGAVHQRDTYYDHPARDFAETDEALRLRRESVVDSAGVGASAGPGAPSDGPEPSDGPAMTASLTYKGPLLDGDSKTREEVETAVDDPGAADAVLRAVGFEPAAAVEKDRERFAVERYVVALDAVRGLGEFVEVEAHAGGGAADAADEVDALRDGAFDLCRRLGLAPEASIRTSYLGLLLEAGP